ncbi:hypothetical protein VPH35_040540 [Triticum aestivum]
MEKEKWHCLNFILGSNLSRNLQDYLKVIARCEKRARRCYSEEIKMDKKSFVQMLLLDQCNTGQEIRSETSCSRADLSCERKEEYTHRISIEECQRPSSNNLELCEVSIGRPPEEKRLKHSEDQNVYTGIWGWCNRSLEHDFLLFENQIPFYIVEEIYGFFIGKEVETSILRHYPTAIYEFDRPKQFHHLLHLCTLDLARNSRRIMEQLLQSQQLGCMEAENIPNRWRRWRRAAQYHEAGITLKKREYDQHNRHSLLDVKFSNGVIEIPCLPIDENTEALFKNLLALEQTGPRYIWQRPQFLYFFHEGIIVHMMDSDEEVSSLFTRLVKKVVINSETSYLKSLCQTLENHYQSRLNRWMAWLWLNYFSNPWVVLAVLAATITLVCTVVQTVFTVLVYINP